MNLENYTQRNIFKETYEKKIGTEASHNMIEPSRSHIKNAAAGPT